MRQKADKSNATTHKRRPLKHARRPSSPDQRVNRRVALVGSLFFVLLAVIGARAAYLQTIKRSWLAERAIDQYEHTLTQWGKRGTIFDTNSQPMAVSIETASVVANPRAVTDARQTARDLAQVLDVDRESLVERLSSNKSFAWIQRRVTPKQVEEIRALGLAGIDFITEQSRYYPGLTLAAQVLGFTGIDGRGLEGLEFFYDNQLQGDKREMVIYKDALGRGFDTASNTDEPRAGNNIILTIDRNIQYITEEALQTAVSQFKAASGMAVVMEPSSGAVLALAHSPSFNPNAFGRFPQTQWRNRAITDPFEPGSTMKIFSAAAAMDSGLVRSDSIFYCEKGQYRIGPNTVHDTKPHGWLSLAQIVKYSSNIGSVKVAETIGSATLYDYLLKFGFGSRTGIDCPGETTGGLSAYGSWTRIDTGAISFGQGISVSAIQLAAATAAIANDGLLMKPYIVQAVTDNLGRPVQVFEPTKVRQVIAASTAQTLKQIMRSVTTTGGTGVQASIQGYNVCGKTGTAQKIGPEGTYQHDKYVASFVGFAPAEQPRVVILVVVDEPTVEHYGGSVAAPAFRRIANETLQYLDVSPANQPNRMRVAMGREFQG